MFKYYILHYLIATLKDHLYFMKRLSHAFYAAADESKQKSLKYI